MIVSSARIRSIAVGLTALLFISTATRAAEADQPRVDAYGDALPKGCLARFGSLRLRHMGGFATLAFSPDARRLLSVSSGKVGLWDVASGKLLTKGILGEADDSTDSGFAHVPTAAWSRDGHVFAAATCSEVQIWDAERLKPKTRLRNKDWRPIGVAIAFSRNGERLLTNSANGTVECWDAGSGKLLSSFAAVQDEDGGSVFDPRGEKLLVAEESGAIQIYDVAAGKLWQTMQAYDFRPEPPGFRRKKKPGHIYQLVVSPDGRIVATLAFGFPVRILDIRSGQKLAELPKAIGDGETSGITGPLVFSSDGETLACGATGDSVQSWSWRTSKLVATSHFGGTSLAFSADGRILAARGSRDITLWDLPTRKPRPRPPGHDLQVDALAFSQEGKMLGTSGRDGRVLLWDVSTSRLSRELLHAARDPRLSFPICFPSDGKTVIAGGLDCTIYFWNANTGKELLRLPGDPIRTYNVAVSGDGSMTATRDSYKGLIKLFLARENKKPSEFFSDSTGADIGWQRMSFSPDGSRLAIIVNDAIQLLDTSSGKQIRRLVDGDLFDGNAIAFSQDGKLLALGAGALRVGIGATQPPVDYTVRLWDTATARMLWKVQGECGPVQSVAVSSQGWVLASGSKGGAIQLWELATGLELLRLETPDNPIYGVAFSPDGKTVASAMHDGTALLWDLAPLDGIAPVAQPVSNLVLDKLLTDLAGEDGHVLYRALWTLSAFPTETTTFLKAELGTRSRDPQERVRQSLADLDAADFERREAASRKLARLGGQAEAALKKAVAQAQSNEVRARASALLQSLANRKFKDVEHQLDRRIVWVLERIGNPEARALLQELAKPGSSYSAADDARAALKRP